jgi:hypothetical protein
MPPARPAQASGTRIASPIRRDATVDAADAPESLRFAPGRIMQNSAAVQHPPGINGSSVHVAMAGARQRLLDAHVTHALDWIVRSRDCVAQPDAVAIYCRLHHLPDSMTEALVHQLLVHIGRLAEFNGADLPHGAAAARLHEWDEVATLQTRMRRRVAGRHNQDLRAWVYRHTGHVERQLLDIHIHNVAALVPAMRGATESEIVDHYVRSIGLQRELWYVLLCGLLDHAFAQAAGSTADAPVPALQPESRRRSAQAAAIDRFADAQLRNA